MHKLCIIYNNKTNLDFNILMQRRSSKPSPNKEYEEKPIPGRETLYIDKGYTDIDITVAFNFLSKTPSDWDFDFRQAKKWLHSKDDNKLIFSDDLDFYYKVKKINIDTPERIMKRLGRFNVTFTCSPYIYKREGLNPIELKSEITNIYEETKPVYLIEGEGYLTLNVNGNIINVNVGQNMVIDVEKGLCFRMDNGEIINNTMKGYYDDLNLIEGKNTFKYSNGFNIKIVPNWRCL